MSSPARLTWLLPLALTLLVPGFNSTASAQPLTAIVNARIVDGSGNEPFAGTVVIEAGRIRAVGRSVEVPAGAVTIDGAGRTVLPGLVDVRLTIDTSTGPNAVARAMAAALYAGVTSVAVRGLAPDRFEAVRALAARPDAGPRASIVGGPDGLRAGAQAIVLTPDATDAASVAADAKSRGIRVFVDAAGEVAVDRVVALEPNLVVGAMALTGGAAPLAQRNVTVAPDFSAGADAARRTETVRTLRDARVRLALISARSGTGYRLAPGGLVEAGASPLEAVTAATSGGAWALGAQSDRGFLAPGMRADLLIVRGDPTTTPADLEAVERVFLGGVDVDRQALLAKIQAFDAPPPAPPTPSVTENKPGASAKAPTGSSRRRGRDRKAPAVAEAPPAATPAPSSPASPATTEPAAPPTAPTAPAATPAPAAPTPAEATPAAAPAVATLDNPLIDDFEKNGNGDSLNAWTSASSEGPSPATIVMGRVVRGLRDHALHLTARMGQGSAPFVRAAIPLAANGAPVDASRFRGIRFDARGEGRYRIVFVTRSIADGRYHESYFSGSPLWTPVGIPFASIGQNGRGGHAAFTARDLIEIRFEIARDAGQMAWLELDNVRFY